MKYSPCLHIVLHQPEIPQNTGAIGRTCVALGAKLWLVRPLGFRMDQKTLRRAGLDYWQHLEYEIADHWEDFLQRLNPERIWYFSRFATRDYTEISYEKGDCLVFGSETAGLPSTITKPFPDHILRIHCEPNVRSLNLASSVAVAGYEAMRQFRL